MTTLKRFDPTLKKIGELFPRDWLDFFLPRLHLPRADRVSVIDSDVSTITSAADKVFRIEGRKPWIFHLELLASHFARLPRQLLLYNVLIGDRHDLPVQSAVLLLRPEADRASIDGKLQLLGPDGKPYHDFRYGVIRLWAVSSDSLLEGGIGLLPLAPVASIGETRLPEVLHRIDERISNEVTTDVANDVWSATYVLLGLKYDQQFIKALMQGVRKMEESTTYQAIIREGKEQGAIEEARNVLLRLGRRHLGRPERAASETIAAVNDLAQLNDMIDRLDQVASWAELLGIAASPRRRSKKGS